MPASLASLFIAAAALVAVGVPLVYLLSRVLKLAPRLPALDNPRREARVAVLVVVVVVATSIPSLLFASGGATSLTDPGMILNVTIADAMLLATVSVAAYATRQSWASLGLSRQALPRLVVLGLVPSALYVPSVGLMYPVASLFGPVPLAIGLVWSAMAGFSEEITFRGYLQTRFEAAWGTWAGYVVTVLVFALAHFPSSYVLYSGNVLDALLSSLGRVGLGVLLGFYYIRSRNVVPGAISHTFYNWALVLWQVPNA
jgi:membrane protease YdiL (CAAX protease family)